MKKRVYQYKISLNEITPEIWRRIQVPETYSFWDLHVAIQDAMGWWDYHLHAFRFRKRKNSRNAFEIGIPDDEFADWVVHPGWEIPITDFFDEVGVRCEYEYDFGDCWQHELLLEGILLREKGQTYPRCLDGEGACPPEDCGGVWGYQHMLEIISDPTHEEHEEMLTWLGGEYDPKDFSPENVKFDKPGWRWRKAFLED